MENSLVLVKSANFSGLTLDCYLERNSNHGSSKEFWATREQIGALLEYAEPTDAIAKIHKRNPERLDKFSRVDNLSRVEGGRSVTREVTVYSFKGLLEICRYSQQPKANAVIDFLWDVVQAVMAHGKRKIHLQ